MQVAGEGAGPTAGTCGPARGLEGGCLLSGVMLSWHLLPEHTLRTQARAGDRGVGGRRRWRQGILA